MRIRLSAQVQTLGMIVLLWMASATAFAQKSAEEEARRYYLRGVAAVEMAKSDEELANAVEEFKKATQIAPGMASAWYNLGMVQSKIGRLKDAIDSFGRYVALVPQSEEAKKLRDEMVKLEYKLEQSEKFKHLAGVWITSDGVATQVVVEGSRLTLHINYMSFPGVIERWMWSDRTPGDDATLDDITLRLDIKGTRLTGVVEIVVSPSSGPSREMWCWFPIGKETNQVEGALLVDGSMLLKIKKTKYKFESNKGENIFFGSSKVRCDAVTPMGDVVVEKTLRGPLPALAKGGVGVQMDDWVRYVINVQNPASGLLPGDEIISVDGIALAELGSTYERMLKLRGEPGSVANLVVKRVLEKAGTFSSEKSALLNFAVQRVEIK